MSRSSLMRLAKMDTFEEVYHTEYYQDYFVKRYINDIPLMALELFNVKLSYQQVDIFLAMNWQGGRLAVPSGHGCHAINTPILMSDGSIKMVQDVKQGDFLMGDDGCTPREVLSLARGKEELYEFTTNDKETRVYNKSHILSLVATQTHGTQKKGDIVHIKISEWLKWSDRKKRTHAFYKSHTKGRDTKLPIDPYFLGAWLGDGTSQSLAITNIDKEVIDSIKEYADSLGCVVHKGEYKGKTNNYVVSSGDRSVTNLSKEFKNLNLYGNKHIPLLFKQSSIEQRLELLAGIIDTDGSLDKRNRRVFEITQKSKTLSYDIVYLARSCGINATIKKVKKSCIYKGQKRVGDYYKISITRNVETIPTRIKRKQADHINNPQRNSLHFGIKEYKEVGVGDYYGFEIDGNHKFLDGGFIVQHNTGKTKFIGVIASAFLLLFAPSIVRIQAPKEDQVTKFSFKEVTSCLEAIWTPRKLGERTIISEWAFLEKFIQINTKTIYIKGKKTSWYIESATAPKGDATNLSGQHNWAYLLVFDECSGIEDAHVQGSLGALSEELNSCVAFSQHTRKSGMFHRFVTESSKSMGGVWDVLRLSSEESPRVALSSLRLWKATYTEDEYRVRVQGLPPEEEDGFLISSKEAYSVYSKKGKEWIDDLIFDTLVMSSDVVYRGLRDSGVTHQIRVATQRDVLGRTLLYLIVEEIDIFNGKSALLPTEQASYSFNKSLKAIDADKDGEIDYIKHVIDASAGGNEAYVRLRELSEEANILNSSTDGVVWASRRMSGMEKRRFYNQRAKAFVMLYEAIKDNRVYIKTRKHRTRVIRELSNIPFEFDMMLRYKIVSKPDMKKRGIASPDIADGLAQMFIPYYEANELNTRFDEDTIDEVDDIKPTQAEDSEDTIEEADDVLGDIKEDTEEDGGLTEVDIDDLLGDTIM